MGSGGVEMRLNSRRRKGEKRERVTEIKGSSCEKVWVFAITRAKGLIIRRLRASVDLGLGSKI